MRVRLNKDLRFPPNNVDDLVRKGILIPCMIDECLQNHKEIKCFNVL